MRQSTSSSMSFPSTMDIDLDESDIDYQLKRYGDCIKMRARMLRKFSEHKREKEVAKRQYQLVKHELEQHEYIMTQIIYAISHVIRHRNLTADIEYWLAKTRKEKVKMQECLERAREYKREEKYWLKILKGSKR